MWRLDARWQLELVPWLFHGRREARSPETSKPRYSRGFPLVGETGFEPATARPPAGCATRLRHSPWSASFYGGRRATGGSRCVRRRRSWPARERATGIEPALEAWKASVQPQHFARGAATVARAGSH